MAHRYRTTLHALLLPAVVCCLTTLAAQDAPGPRRILADISAPGIDRGARTEALARPVARAAPGGNGVDARGTFAPRRLMIKFRGDTTPAARQRVRNAAGAVASEQPTWADFEVLTVETDDTEGTARRLRALPDVEYAQVPYRAAARFVPDDPLYGLQWNLPLLDMPRAWDINPGADASITVAVIDSGVAFQGGTLRFFGRTWRSPEGVLLPALGPVDVPFAAAPELGAGDRFVAPWDFVWNDDRPFDLDGHGTHVAGTLGALTGNGVGVAGMAFNVRIMPVKVLDSAWDFAFGSPAVGTDDLVARGIRYAADNGAQIINMSLGRIEGGPATAVREAIAYAVSRGVFVVVSGGNEGLDGNQPDRYAEFAPEIDGMVAVAAIGPDRSRAPYSTVGAYVELAAPGGSGGASGSILQQTFDFDLTDTWTRRRGPYRAPRFDVFAYQPFQGTSMAAPHVAGLAAMLMQQGITNPSAIEAAMKRFATDLGPAGPDPEYGYGLINPRASLRGLGLVR
ncbi:MAG: S8 family serine peptidase [Vicinamibacterales bacterium]